MKRILPPLLSLDVLPEPRTLEDAVRWSAWAVRAVAVGRIDARTCHEINFGINSFKAAVEKRDLLKQVAELEARLKEHEKRKTGRV